MPNNDDVTPTISAKNVEHAFDNLHSELKTALDMFRDHTSSADNGLRATLYALRAVLKLLEISPEAVKLSDPLIRLYGDLRSLQEGTPSPMLKAKPKASRPPANQFYHALKGVAVFTVRMLMPTGMSRADARKAVADVLTRKGISPAGSTRKISERTIRKWEDDIGIDATATKMLRSVEAGVLEDVSAIVTRAARQPPENYSPNGAPNSEDQPATDSDIRHVFLSALSDFAAIHGRRRTT